MTQDKTLRQIILLVDDSGYFRSWFRRLLEKYGYHVLEAANGLEAVEVVSGECPDLVIMDMSMPIMDGPTATRRIREGGGPCQNVPILALSAEEEMKEEALRAGCNDYFTKENIHRLIPIIQHLLEGR